MKKKIIISLITLIGIICIIFIVDLVNIKLNDKPIIILKTKEGSDQIYYGLFYDTYNCLLNKGAVIKSKNSKYTCPKEEINVYTIEDETRLTNNFSCDEALEEIYKTEEYSYNLTCIKSKYINVIYTDGSKQNIKEALKNNKISINDLNKYKIEYVKVPLKEDIEPIDPTEVKETPNIDNKPSYNTGNTTTSSTQNTKDTIIISPEIKKESVKEKPSQDYTVSNKTIEIIDKTKGKYCAEAIDYFYKNYYFSCKKSNYVYVKINNQEYLLKDALRDKIVTMKELESAGYRFLKNKKMEYADR